MNRINPIYALALLLIIILMLVYKLDSSKNELKDNILTYEATQKVAVKLSALKDTYANKTKTKKALKSILNNALLKSLDTKFKKTSLSISAKSINAKTLNFLMSKIINGSFIISSMKISRISDTNVELKMEIKW